LDPTANNEQSARRYRHERTALWDGIAARSDSWRGWGGYYHRRIEELYRQLVAPGQRVLELGSGDGNLLAALAPSYGVGVDFSFATVQRARARHRELHFLHADAHELPLRGTFDVIVLSDLVNDLWDVQTMLAEVARVSHPRTRVILNFYSAAWELPLRAAQKLGVMRPLLPQNWLTRHDVANLLELAGLETVRVWGEILMPLPIPLLAPLANRYLAKLWPLDHADMTSFVVARPAAARTARTETSVSVIVPARNEAGNVEAIFQRVPELGTGTELIFVEGHSSDDTYAAIERAIAAHPERRASLYRQTGKGKGDAVRLGYDKATGDVLMILDADLTVPPEDLPRFYEAIVTGRGEFINGVRLVYPMEKQAMRAANLLANKFFSGAFSWLLGQRIKDTLCGTKVLRKRDYERIAANRAHFGNFDPFGDFDLLFGAAKLTLKIVDLPIRYRERLYGTTNIQRWRHGVLLLRMVVFAARRIRFL
jgi:SAM-dependent methyltransferase